MKLGLFWVMAVSAVLGLSAKLYFPCFTAGIYKLRPANKTDHLCQSWQCHHMFMKFTNLACAVLCV